MRDCELRLAPRTPGVVVAEPGFYAAVLRETREELRDKEPLRVLYAVRDGVDVGFAAFRRFHKWEQGRPSGRLEVGPRGATAVTPYDNLWIRIVDLPAALPLRTYADDCDVVVEVADDAAPWQAGRWRIVVRDGEAVAQRSEAEPLVALPVAALGAAYLGATNLLAQQQAGLLTQRRPRAVAELWQAFRTEVAPSAAMNF